MLSIMPGASWSANCLSGVEPGEYRNIEAINARVILSLDSDFPTTRPGCSFAMQVYSQPPGELKIGISRGP